MTINAAEYRSIVGLDSLYVAAITEDCSSAYTPDTPVYLAPVAEASQEPAIATETEYADNQPYDTITTRGETKITLMITGLPAYTYAWLTGGVFDAASGRVWDNEGTPPYFALGFRAKKANGSYRYYWFLKGTFAPPKEDAATQSDAPDIKKPQLVFTAIKSIYKFDLGVPADDSIKRVFGDDDTDSFDETGWFTQVQTPTTVTPSALALSSSDPADGASGVVVSVNITLTFNNALPADAITNVVLAKADGTFHASVNSLDATKKIITMNPGSNMDGSSTYIVTYGVTDIYGQTLNGAINFGTA